MPVATPLGLIGDGVQTAMAVAPPNAPPPAGGKALAKACGCSNSADVRLSGPLPLEGGLAAPAGPLPLPRSIGHVVDAPL